jgi:hypothetical protein
MKKFITLALVLGSFAGAINAYAATNGEFTDKSSFASWFAPAVQKMQFNGIMTGYQNGSFLPASNVTRAELAVIMDRLATVIGNPLDSSPRACTLNFVYGLTLHIYDQNGQPVNDAKISVDADVSPVDKDFSGANGVYSGLGEAQTGYYTITIEKAGYATYYETIKMENGGCHVKPQTRTITIFAQK